MNSLYGSKTLSYLGCKAWEDIPSYLKDQSYLGAFKSGLKIFFLKGQSDRCKILFYLYNFF